MQEISVQSGQMIFPGVTAGASASPARTSASPEREPDSKAGVPLCFFAVTGLIRDLEEKDRPSYLFIENVKNLFSVNGGFDFARLLVELDEIGYDAEWSLINSSDVVPQNRERVFVVGHLRGRCTRPVFPVGETDGIYPGSVEDQTPDNKIALCLTAGANKSWTGNFVKQIGNVMPTKTRGNPNQGRVYNADGIAPCLNKMDGGGREPMIAQRGRGSNKGGIHDIAPTVSSSRYEQNNMAILPVITPEREAKRQNGRRVKNDGEPMFTLTSKDIHGVVGLVC